MELVIVATVDWCGVKHSIADFVTFNHYFFSETILGE